MEDACWSDRVMGGPGRLSHSQPARPDPEGRQQGQRVDWGFQHESRQRLQTCEHLSVPWDQASRLLSPRRREEGLQEVSEDPTGAPCNPSFLWRREGSGKPVPVSFVCLTRCCPVVWCGHCFFLGGLLASGPWTLKCGWPCPSVRTGGGRS